MKRQERVQALIDRIGDIDPGVHVCPREFTTTGEACKVCDITDALADALIAFETAEFLGHGADVVDAEPIA